MRGEGREGAGDGEGSGGRGAGRNGKGEEGELVVQVMIEDRAVCLQGTSSASEVGEAIRAALADAGVKCEGEEGAEVAASLRRLGRCLVVVDHWDAQPNTNEILLSLLTRSPELRLLISTTENLSFPGVGQRQVLSKGRGWERRGERGTTRGK